MTYGDQTSEETISVKSDPRLTISKTNIDDVYDTGKQIEVMQQEIADAVKQLVESKNIAKKYQSDLKKLDKEKYKEEIKASKNIIKEIDSLITIYIGKVDKRQGITRSPEMTVSRRLGLASSYVNSSQNGLTRTETQLIELAENAINDAFDKTNTFFNDDWTTYQSKMEELNINPFKETKSFKID